MTFDVKVTDGLGLAPKVVVIVGETLEDVEGNPGAVARLQAALEGAVQEVLQREGLQREFEAEQRRRPPGDGQ